MELSYCYKNEYQNDVVSICLCVDGFLLRKTTRHKERIVFFVVNVLNNVKFITKKIHILTEIIYT